MRRPNRSADLVEREFAEIAGRVRSMAIGSEGGVNELRCVIADNSGSITLDLPGPQRSCRASSAVRGLMVKGTVTTLRREAVILNPQYEIVAAAPGRPPDG